MSKLHIKKGDTVIVNSGEDKGIMQKLLWYFVEKHEKHRKTGTSTLALPLLV